MPREPYGSQIPPKPPKRKGTKGMVRPIGPAPKRRDGETPKKEMSPMRPLGPAPKRKTMPDIKPKWIKDAMSQMTQSKRMTAQAQSIAMDKVKKKRSTAADSKRKTSQAIDMLGKKKAASNKTPKGFKRMGPVKKKQGR